MKMFLPTLNSEEPEDFTAIFAPKQAVRVDAIRAEGAVLKSRRLPLLAWDQLVKDLLYVWLDPRICLA